MLAQRVIEPELPIGLAFCASIYTDERFYKDDGKETNKRLPWDMLSTYNLKDCIVTHQTREAQEAIFASDPILSRDKDFIFSRIPIASVISRSGMGVDVSRREAILAATNRELEKAISGLGIASGFEFNHRSPAQIKKLLFDELGLPHRTNRDGGLTTNEDAIVSLLHVVRGKIDSLKTPDAKAKWQLKEHTLKLLLKVRGLEKMISSYLTNSISPDGRIRSTYYAAGTDTGRWSCGTFVDGTGLNAQTLPRESVVIDGN